MLSSVYNKDDANNSITSLEKFLDVEFLTLRILIDVIKSFSSLSISIVTFIFICHIVFHLKWAWKYLCTNEAIGFTLFKIACSCLIYSGVFRCLFWLCMNQFLTEYINTFCLMSTTKIDFFNSSFYIWYYVSYTSLSNLGGNTLKPSLYFILVHNH